MQFKIWMTDAPPDLGAIEDAIGAVDPSVMVDIDPASQALRVATSLDVADLLELMEQAGYPLAWDQLQRVPSECCGGCGG